MTPEDVKLREVLARDDSESLRHALEIGRMGAPYTDHQGHLYMAERYKSDTYRDAEFRDYGLARAVRVLLNNTDTIEAMAKLLDEVERLRAALGPFAAIEAAGYWWAASKGRITPGEPLFAVQIIRGGDSTATPIAEAEADTLEGAAVAAMAALQPSGDGK